MSGLVWAAEHDYEMLGTRIRIRFDTSGVDEKMNRLLAPFHLGRKVAVRGRNCFGLVDGDHLDNVIRSGRFLAYRDCQTAGIGEGWSDAVAGLMASLNRSVIMESPYFATHAGVVAVNGKAVALPAASGGGKSTLTAACLKTGFEYVSDEALCFDLETGSVIPYPKPIGLSNWSRRTLGVGDVSLAFPPEPDEGLVTAGDLGASIATNAVSLEHVVIAEYGHDTMEISEAAGSEAMSTILQMSFNHYKFGEAAFHGVAKLANSARTWRLTYDDPLEAAELLRDRLLEV